MVAMRIEDLAKVMIQELAPAFGYDPDEIGIDLVGRRVGETLDEKVVTEREAARVHAHEHEELYAVPPETTEGNGYLSHDGLTGFEPIDDFVRSSADADLLDRAEIAVILENAGVLEVQQ
jgi:FlaA1/EpsC-like NDP-sugar epimerase